MYAKKEAPGAQYPRGDKNSILAYPMSQPGITTRAVRPTECRCYIKEETPFMAQRVRKRYRGQYALRLPYNSPFQQHFTQGFLLCSGGSIHHLEEIVNTQINIFLFIGGSAAAVVGADNIRPQHKASLRMLVPGRLPVEPYRHIIPAIPPIYRFFRRHLWQSGCAVPGTYAATAQYPPAASADAPMPPG